MEKQSVTIYTVAREARVSMATVSRVVNGNPNVKPETRQKVLDVIKQLNYRPNAVARGLASKKTTTVGVVIPNITDPYFAELALGIDDVASMYKYNIILTNSDSDDEKILKVVRSLLAKQVAGLFVMVAGSVVNDEVLPSVRINYQAAAKEATEFLLKHGDQQVAYITGPLRYSINGEDRLNGYKEALANNNVAFNESLVIETDGSYQAGYAKAQEVIEKGLKAAYVTDDSLAAGLLNGLTDAGISVPADFELISSNDTNYTKVVRPTITSITQPLYDLGAISMRLLTKLMDGDDSNDDEKNVILDHGFVERQSTRK